VYIWGFDILLRTSSSNTILFYAAHYTTILLVISINFILVECAVYISGILYVFRLRISYALQLGISEMNANGTASCHFWFRSRGCL